MLSGALPPNALLWTSAAASASGSDRPPRLCAGTASSFAAHCHAVGDRHPKARACFDKCGSDLSTGRRSRRRCDARSSRFRDARGFNISCYVIICKGAPGPGWAPPLHNHGSLPLKIRVRARLPGRRRTGGRLGGQRQNRAVKDQRGFKPSLAGFPCCNSAPRATMSCDRQSPIRELRSRKHQKFDSHDQVSASETIHRIQQIPVHNRDPLA